MRIIHYIDDFLYSLFPEINRGDKDQLISALQEFYSVDSNIPTVNLSGEMVIIDVDTTSITAEESKYRQILALCDQKKFTQAKPLLENLIKNNPTKSEYHRVLGQILFEESNFDGAMDSLIDSLRW